jgi:hypothetical protein
VAILDQNRWPLSIRISGHFESESLAGFNQNMHFTLKAPKIRVKDTAAPVNVTVLARVK